MHPNPLPWGRVAYGEVVLVGRLRPAIQRLNPPDLLEEAVKTVLGQAELLAAQRAEG